MGRKTRCASSERRQNNPRRLRESNGWKRSELEGAPRFHKRGKISGCSYVSKDEGHNENYSHRFSARSPDTFPDDGGPVFWRAKWDDPGLGNCDLHECVRLFLLGQNRFAL